MWGCARIGERGSCFFSSWAHGCSGPRRHVAHDHILTRKGKGRAEKRPFSSRSPSLIRQENISQMFQETSPGVPCDKGRGTWPL